MYKARNRVRRPSSRLSLVILEKSPDVSRPPLIYILIIGGSVAERFGHQTCNLEFAGS